MATTIPCLMGCKVGHSGLWQMSRGIVQGVACAPVHATRVGEQENDKQLGVHRGTYEALGLSPGMRLGPPLRCVFPHRLACGGDTRSSFAQALCLPGNLIEAKPVQTTSLPGSNICPRISRLSMGSQHRRHGATAKQRM